VFGRIGRSDFDLSIVLHRTLHKGRPEGQMTNDPAPIGKQIRITNDQMRNEALGV
jgi:hypothetical protein